MLLPRPSRVLLAAALLCAATAARALERVTLHNGFTYDCARREAIDATHVRLYLTADAANFIDLSAQSIAAIEPLPDPPPSPVVAAPSPAPAPLTTHDLLARAGQLHNIDIELLLSIVNTESAGHTNAVSRTGARGLMQLMPATAASLGVTDAFRPDQNISGGTTYLDTLLTRYHDNLSLALAAYNAGPGAVDRYHGIPPYRETRAYVLRVMTEFKRRKLAAERTASSSTTALATIANR